MPLIVISPSSVDVVAVAGEVAGEADDRVALGVEELGREQVRLEVLVLESAMLSMRAEPVEPAVGEASPRSR